MDDDKSLGPVRLLRRLLAARRGDVRAMVDLYHLRGVLTFVGIFAATIVLPGLLLAYYGVAGIRAHGLGGRIKHMADPPFLFPIEVIGEVSRVVSLSARLFGNVFAGEVLLGVMFALGAALKIALLPIVFPVIFLFLEVLFGTIQALVFSLLASIYLAMVLPHHDHDHEHDENYVDEHPLLPGAEEANQNSGHVDAGVVPFA